MIARVSMLSKLRASPDMLAFSLCNKNSLAMWRINRPVFPTTLSVLSEVIGKYVVLRIYKNPFVFKIFTLKEE